jgi:hypothetical protein
VQEILAKFFEMRKGEGCVEVNPNGDLGRRGEGTTHGLYTDEGGHEGSKMSPSRSRR